MTKHQLFALASRGQIGPETRIVVNGKESKAGKVSGIKFGTEIDSESLFGQSHPIKDDALDWEKIQVDLEESTLRQQRERKGQRERTLKFHIENPDDGYVPMKSVFPHLANLGPMLMWYNFFFFLFAAFTTCGIYMGSLWYRVYCSNRDKSFFSGL